MKPTREQTAKMVRCSLGLSIEKFAGICGVSYRTYWLFETGGDTGILSKIKIMKVILDHLKKQATLTGRLTNPNKGKHKLNW